MRRGFTLVELVVVLVLMGLAVGLVAPALRPPQPAAESAVAPLLRTGRTAAVARGEPMVLKMNGAGSWRLDARGTGDGDPVASGIVSPPPAAAFSIDFSPLGTCAADVRSGSAESLALEPLTCEIHVR